MAEGVSLGPHIAAIRRTFTEARDYAPSILFIDEIDSIGSREKLAGDSNGIYQTEVVNAVLEQIQGLDPAAPVVVIGATNNEDSVDPALRRAGRLDRVIRIPRPEQRGARPHLPLLHRVRWARALPLDPALDTVALGRLSVGLTGADVERIVRGASRRARKARRPMSQTDVIDEITEQAAAAPRPILRPDAGRHRAHGDPRGRPRARALPQRIEGRRHRLRDRRPAGRTARSASSSRCRTSAST